MALYVIISAPELETVLDALLKSARDDVLVNGRMYLLVQKPEGHFAFWPDNRLLHGWHEIGDGSTLFISRQATSVPVVALQTRCPVQPSVPIHELFVKLRSKKLEPLLREFKLDWGAQSEEAYQRYTRRRSSFSLNAWLTQFERLGDRRAGEILARMLAVHDTSRFVEAYHPERLVEGARHRILGVGSRMGKSGAHISSFLRNFAKAEILEFAEAIEFHVVREREGPLHVFEDGLWTGIELKRVLDSLLGRAPVGREKVRPLRNLSWLNDLDIRLHYLIQTDLGRHAAEGLLRDEGLEHVQIEAPQPGGLISVLSESGVDRFLGGSYTFQDVEKHALRDGDVIPALRSFKSSWCDTSMVDRVCAFVERHGWLYTQAMNGLPHREGDAYDSHLPYGANHIGLYQVFSHCAPRAALPVFWCDGEMRLTKTRKFRWQALVPEVAFQEPEDA